MKDQDERYDYLDYIDELSEEEAEWVRKFYQEYHFDTGYKGKRILKSKEAKREASRNNNMNKTDAFFRARKEGDLGMLNENHRQFMEDASDEWEWQDAFKVGGPEAALEHITNQTLRDLENNKLDKKTTLMRYYEKRDRLRRQINRERHK